jgi:hypothetical protein
MRKLFWTIWCLLPLGGVAYHFGPGQERMLLDRADAAAREARGAADLAAGIEGDAAAEHWARAAEQFEAALELLPAGHDGTRARLTLERAKCRMLCGQLPEANADLSALVDELAHERADPDPELLADARRTYASSEYYMTWLSRLEGAPREEWEPRIEAARQTYKLLAQDEGLGEEQRRGLQEDLEASIRLARMELSELQGLPLPSQ